jgi:hypothetical protein
VRALRVLGPVALASSITLAAAPARAEPPDRDPDPGMGVVAGVATLVLGFAVGGTMIATASGSNGPSNAGWLIMNSGLVLAPLAAHGAVGQWGRGLVFSALPAATEGGAVALFEYDSGTILHGSLPEQRLLWGLFGAGLIGSIVGIIDVAITAPRIGPVTVSPSVARDGAGLQVGGTL